MQVLTNLLSLKSGGEQATTETPETEAAADSGFAEFFAEQDVAGDAGVTLDQSVAHAIVPQELPLGTQASEVEPVDTLDLPDDPMAPSVNSNRLAEPIEAVETRDATVPVELVSPLLPGLTSKDVVGPTVVPEIPTVQKLGQAGQDTLDSAQRLAVELGRSPSMPHEASSVKVSEAAQASPNPSVLVPNRENIPTLQQASDVKSGATVATPAPLLSDTPIDTKPTQNFASAQIGMEQLRTTTREVASPKTSEKPEPVVLRAPETKPAEPRLNGPVSPKLETSDPKPPIALKDIALPEPSPKLPERVAPVAAEATVLKAPSTAFSLPSLSDQTLPLTGTPKLDVAALTDLSSLVKAQEIQPPRMAITPTVPEILRADTLISRVSAGFEATIARGAQGSFELKLQPAELGLVRVVLSPSETGLSAVVNADRADVLDLLRRNGDALLNDLRNINGGEINLAIEAVSHETTGLTLGLDIRL